MELAPVLALSLLVAMPSYAQTAADPTTPTVTAVTVAPAMPAEQPDPATTGLNNSVLAIHAITAAKAQIAQDEFAKQMASFNAAKVKYESDKQANDQDRAAATKLAADYQKNLAAWKVEIGSKAVPVAAKPVRVASASDIVVNGSKPRRVCRTETTTGSLIERKVCRMVGDLEQERNNAQRDAERMMAGGLVAPGGPPTAIK